MKRRDPPSESAAIVSLFRRKKESTGLFIASGTFDTPLISVVDGPILKPFGVVIVITVRFDLVYDNA